MSPVKTDLKTARMPSRADMVLAAMNQASKGTTSRVPYEEIVIFAWKAYPEAFSLRSHPEHPDGSDVHKCLYKDLVAKGLVVSLGNKVFRLTDEGLAKAARLGERQAPASGDGKRLSRSEELLLRHLRASRPHAIWLAGKKSELVDYDARLFFQFSSSTGMKERRRRAESAVAAIEKARAAGSNDWQSLLGVADYLRNTFLDLFEEKE